LKVWDEAVQMKEGRNAEKKQNSLVVERGIAPDDCILLHR
jgi:hypothetical protein